MVLIHFNLQLMILTYGLYHLHVYSRFVSEAQPAARRIVEGLPTVSRGLPT
jgi:hypothetical protein